MGPNGRNTLRVLEHKRAITAIAFHPTEFLLATAGMDKTIKFFDIDSFHLVSTITTGASAAKCIQFHPDGTFLIATVQDQMKLFTWEPVKCLEQVEVPWNNVSDFSIQRANNRIVACTIQESFVSPFVVKLYDPNERFNDGSREGQKSGNGRVKTPNKKSRSPRRSPKDTSPITLRRSPRTRSNQYEGKTSTSFLDKASSSGTNEALAARNHLGSRH